jgi:hypothetical protein
MMSVFYVEKCPTLSIFRKIGAWLIWCICKMAQKAKKSAGNYASAVSVKRQKSFNLAG